MNPNCPVLPGPYVPPECIPWPQNEHEAHILIAIWIVTWTLGFLLMFLHFRRLEAAEAAQKQAPKPAASKPEANLPFFPLESVRSAGASQGSALRSDR
jgi:hypothetical protein